MFSGKLTWVPCVVAILVVLQMPLAAHGQADGSRTVALTLESKVSLPPADAESQRIVIVQEGETKVRSLVRVEGERVLVAEDGTEVVLPHNLPVLVSRDGNVILQYGDEQDLSHPAVTSLHWLNADGEELGSSVRYYRADALVSMSEDGFTAVVGTLVEGSGGKCLSLFTPEGERVWEIRVGEDRNVHAEPVVAPLGERVVVLTTDAEKPLVDHRILVVDGDGEEVNVVESTDIVQKMVDVGRGRALFVQGAKRHGLIDLSDGQLIWSKDGNVRLIAPRGAGMSPGGDVLFLVLADWQGRPQAAYRWLLNALDATDGSLLGTADLPGEMPSTRFDVFGRLSDDAVEILYGPDKHIVTWSMQE